MRPAHLSCPVRRYLDFTRGSSTCLIVLGRSDIDARTATMADPLVADVSDRAFSRLQLSVARRYRAAVTPCRPHRACVLHATSFRQAIVEPSRFTVALRQPGGNHLTTSTAHGWLCAPLSATASRSRSAAGHYGRACIMACPCGEDAAAFHRGLDVESRSLPTTSVRPRVRSDAHPSPLPVPRGSPASRSRSPSVRRYGSLCSFRATCHAHRNCAAVISPSLHTTTGRNGDSPSSCC